VKHPCSNIYNPKKVKVIVLNLLLDFSCGATWPPPKENLVVFSFAENVRSSEVF